MSVIRYVEDIKNEFNGGCGPTPQLIDGRWQVLCTCGAIMVPVLLRYPEYLRDCDIPDCISCKSDRFEGKAGAFYSCSRDGCDGIHSANRVGDDQVGKPMGTTGSAVCQKLRHYAHIEFDHLWTYLKKSRAWGYKLLARLMKMDVRSTHMALFDINKCKRAIKIIRQWKNARNIPLVLPYTLN